jgi:steroid 5-alpha reductase family enzyme
MESYTDIIVSTVFILFVSNTAVWLGSLYLNRPSIADMYWGIGFIIVAVVTFLQSDGFFPRKVLLTSMILIWGARLSVHIFFRDQNREEDPRYTAMRQSSGQNFKIVSLFKIFWLQGGLLLIIASGALWGILSQNPARLTLYDLVGAIIWATGFAIEVKADRQLTLFKRRGKNRTKIMDHGLWHYSRHPNYFGESLLWWGIFVITVQLPGGFWTIISPLLITFLLLKVSGIVMLEQHLATHPGYKEYIQTTSPFIPLPKKKVKK